MNKDKQEWTLLMENKTAEMLESESKMDSTERP